MISPVYAVYIMTNPSRRPFYTGFTGRLSRRAFEHKLHVREGFTARYNLHRLVYFELYHDPNAGIAREKQIQGWTRAKKIALIESKNPAWDDLAREWGQIWKPSDIRPRLGS
jgi:putative endonuclease